MTRLIAESSAPIDGAFRLRAAVFGAVAEHHLGEHLKTIPTLSRVTAIDEDGKPDFELVYKDRLFRIECKNVLRNRSPQGPRVDFQKTRASKNDPCSRYYKASQFEVLAACLHPISEAWDFRFVATGDLDPHASCPGRLSQKVVVAGDRWTTDVEDVLNELL